LTPRSMRRFSIAVGAVGAALVSILAASTFSSGADNSATSQIETTISQFEDANLAVFSPLATSASDNSECSSGGCQVTLGIAVSAPQAVTQLSDEPATQPADTLWSSPATIKARFNTAVISARNQDALNSLAAPSLINGTLATASKFFDWQVSVLSGHYSECGNSFECSVTAAAGASIVKFSDIQVSGSTATATAIVHAWQQMASIGATGSISGWRTAQGNLLVNYQLAQTSSGQWTITSRSGDFLPGEGP
jgi:hypothetical protein